MARGSYWATWFPPDENPRVGILDGFLTAREAIASAETSVEQSGGGAVAFSQMEGRPAVLLRKFGHLWPEAETFREGNSMGEIIGHMAEDTGQFHKGQKVRLKTFDLPSRKERRQLRRPED